MVSRVDRSSSSHRPLIALLVGLCMCNPLVDVDVTLDVTLDVALNVALNVTTSVMMMSA